MMSNHEVQFLEDGPSQDFTGTTLQLGENKSADSACPNLQNPEVNRPSANNKQDVALVPWSGEDPRDFFSHRREIIEKAIKDCVSEVISQEDGDLLGSWLLTEISFWDNEKERLVALTSTCILTIKYDFIAMKTLDIKRVPLEHVDTLVIGELEYPPHSLIPRLNGIVTGVSGVVKGCLVRPLQDRFTSSQQADLNANPLTLTSFEPKSRNMRGLRTMWNHGQPLAFTKKWNPFTSDIPWNTYTSHPLLWHKEGDEKERSMFNVDDFAYHLVQAVERVKRTTSCSIEHKPILLENYVGIGSLIHNKNALGFFKVRGKFSF